MSNGISKEIFVAGIVVSILVSTLSASALSFQYAGLQGPRGPQGLQGLQGATGATGATGMNGATWWNGTGTPASGLGHNGDFYLDLVNSDVYNKISDSWTKVVNIQGATGPLGPKGDKGDTGATGLQGPEGLQGLTGATGATGAAGANGATWWNGTGTPTTNLGSNGDFYLNLDNGDVYNKISGLWSIVANIQGTKGDKGDTGATGPEGPKGDTGDVGPQGPAGAFTIANMSGYVPAAAYDSGWVIPQYDSWMPFVHNLNTTNLYVYILGQYNGLDNVTMHQWLLFYDVQWMIDGPNEIKVNVSLTRDDWDAVRVMLWKIAEP